MRKLFIFIFGFLFFYVRSQDIQLTFTGSHMDNVVELDSILITNIDEGDDTVLYSSSFIIPGAVSRSGSNLTFTNGLSLHQNFPNPFDEYTGIQLALSVHDNVSVSVFNPLGQKICFFTGYLEEGNHLFLFYPGNDSYYLLMVNTPGDSKYIKMLHSGSTSGLPELIYNGTNRGSPGLKNTAGNFSFSGGDQLRFIGFATVCGIAESDTIEDTPQADKNYSFIFSNDVPSISGSISGQASICKGSVNIMYSVPLSSDINYTWAYSGNGNIVSGQGTHSISMDFDEYSSSGTLTVIPSNGCGNGSPVDMNITVNPLPEITLEATKTEIFKGETITIAATGAVSYQWENNLGSTSSVEISPVENTRFLVSGTDANGCSGTAFLDIKVYNSLKAEDDTVNTDEDASVLADIVSNDINHGENDAILSGFTQGSFGSVTQEGQMLRYTPGADFNGSDQFEYYISNGTDNDTGSVYITINPLNDIPEAANDIAVTAEDTSILIDVLNNDEDIDGDVLSITAFIQGVHGTVAQEGNQLRFEPELNYCGTDSFTYEISDGNGGTCTAKVLLTLNCTNDRPDAVDDNLSLNEDETALTDVLSNDTDAEGDVLTVSGFTQGLHGVVAAESGKLRYTPSANYNGTDEFMYFISDGNGEDTAKVYLTVNEVNDIPQAGSDMAETGEDASILIGVLNNDEDIDGDVLSITGFIQGVHGTVALEGNQLRFEPELNYCGADSFTYELSDGNGGTCTGKVLLTVNCINDRPEAVDDNLSLNEDETALTDVLSNDTDAEGDALALFGFTQGLHGTVAAESGKLRYTPAADYNGTDEFNYYVSDGNGGVDTAKVSITVNSVNDMPIAADDEIETNEDNSVLCEIINNDFDTDGDIITIESCTQGSHGTVTKEGNDLRYTPTANYYGNDSYTYVINDGKGARDTAFVLVTIYSVNDAPVPTGDDVSVEQDATVLISVLTNDSDVEGDVLTITGFTQGSHGMVSLEANKIRYTPDAGYNGPDSFTYSVSDGNGGTSTTTVNVTVEASGPMISLDFDEPDGQTDYITLTITQSGTYQLMTTFYLVDCDPVMYLLDGSYNEVVNNDDYMDLYPVIIFNLDPGTYYIKIDELSLSHLYCHLEVTKM